MEDPAKEIEGVVLSCTAAINAESQRTAIERYYAPDAEFHHPLCMVTSKPMSRDEILGIYQWYRILSPTLKVEVKDVTYHVEKNELFVEVVQEFHIRWSPLSPAPARLMVHLILSPSEEDPRLQVIKYHEDFYQPEDFLALLVPPLVPVIRLFLHVGTIASNLNARIFGALGYWAVPTSKSSENKDD
ncbi:hypothetical protein ABKN59_007500 [Abortiporus biennis]